MATSDSLQSCLIDLSQPQSASGLKRRINLLTIIHEHKKYQGECYPSCAEQFSGFSCGVTPDLHICCAIYANTNLHSPEVIKLRSYEIMPAVRTLCQCSRQNIVDGICEVAVLQVLTEIGMMVNATNSKVGRNKQL